MLIYRMLKKINFLDHLSLVLVFPFLLFLSLNIYKDYGISIDEESTRLHGLVSLNYICELFFPNQQFEFQVKNDIPLLNEYPFKEYGVFFEIILIFLIEILFNVTNFNEIFYLRHLFTNFLFLSSLIFFYIISLSLFKSKFISLISVLILYTSPRIFAESFYNDKDIVFLSIFIYLIFFSIRFLQKTNYLNAFMLSLILAITINIRVVGIYMLFLIIFFSFMQILMKKNLNLKKIYILIFFFFSSFFLLFILWPFLWEAPLSNFLFSLKSFSKYPWGGNVFYLGNFYQAQYLPWHYFFVFFFATTPLFLSLIIISGVCSIILRFIKRLVKVEESKPQHDIWRSENERNILFILFTVLTPLMLIYFFNSVIYNGWRHLYFIYPALILIGISFLININFIYLKNKIKIILYLLLISVCLNNIFNLIKLHPYQYVYFNYFFQEKANSLFEIDYWGVSNKSSLEKIFLDNPNKDKIVIGVASFTDLYLSKKMLPNHMQKKIIISGQDFSNADYIISNNYFEINPKFNDKYVVPKEFTNYYKLKKNNIIIAEFYKRK